MKLGFPRAQPGSVKPPTEIRPEQVGLPTPLKVEPPEPKPWWIMVVAILVIGERPPVAAFAGLALVMLGLALVVRAELRSAAS